MKQKSEGDGTTRVRLTHQKFFMHIFVSHDCEFFFFFKKKLGFIGVNGIIPIIQ